MRQTCRPLAQPVETLTTGGVLEYERSDYTLPVGPTVYNRQKEWKSNSEQITPF